MKKLTRIAAFLCMGTFIFLAQSCLFNFSSSGACEGYSYILDETYCYDDWTKADCQEWDDQQVNGADWYFYPGQTCWDRGW